MPVRSQPAVRVERPIVGELQQCDLSVPDAAHGHQFLNAGSHALGAALRDHGNIENKITPGQSPFQPPPSAWISDTAAICRSICTCTSARRAFAALACAVTTSV